MPKANEHKFLLALRQENNKYFFSDAKDDMLSHICWYKRVESDPTERFFIIDVRGEPVGTISLSNIDFINGRAEYGRFCIASRHRGKGYGRAAMQGLLAYAFGKLNLHRIWGDVLESNEEAIKLNIGLGFKQEGIFRDHVRKSDLYLNVVRMAILEDEWQRHSVGS